MSQEVFLLLDEVPCNSDSGTLRWWFGKPSGNWTELKLNGVNLMMALKPIDDSNVGESQLKILQAGASWLLRPKVEI